MVNIRIALTGIAVALLTAHVPTQSATRYGVADLGTLGGSATMMNDIGDFGSAMVGQSQTASGALHAILQGRPGLRDLGTLGGAQSAAFAIGGNTIVGQAQTASGQEHAFAYELYPTARMIDLGTLGGTTSAAYGAEYGIIVGASKTAGDARLRAFSYVNGTMTPVAVDWGGDSVARAVSDDLIVGYACTAGNASCRAFSSKKGAVTDLGSLGGNSVATSVNYDAQIAGTSALRDRTTRHAFLYANGSMTDLGTLGGRNSEAFDINSRGDVVGTSDTATGGPHAFIWSSGVMTDLNTLLPAGSGWTLRTASGITDGRQIVGTGTLNGVQRGFLLTPPTDLSLEPYGARSQLDGNLPRGVQVGKTVYFVVSTEALSFEPVTVYGARVTDTLSGPAEWISATSYDGTDKCQITPNVITCDMGPIDAAGFGGEVVFRARATGPGAISHTAVISSATDFNSGNDRVSEANWAVALSTMTLTPSTLAGGKASSARVTLTDVAPNSDALVRLSSSAPQIASVPSTVDVMAGTTSRAFNIIPAVVSQPTQVEISATYGLVTITKTLTVVPPALSQLYLTPTTVVGGCGRSAGKIVLNGAAPAGGAAVRLSTTNTMAVVPATVTVPAGASTVSFSVPSKTVTANAGGTVTASYGGVSKTLTFTVRPIRAKTLTLSPNPVKGGGTVKAAVTLECAAPAGGIVVTLTSGNSAVATPMTSKVTIPAGATTATFDVRTSRVAASTNVSIYAWVYGVRKSATLTITP